MAEFATVWWVWASAALVLALTELILPGFLFLGFAFGAAAVMIILLLPVEVGLATLTAAFAALSLLAWIALRRTFRGPAGQVKRIHKDVNE